MSSHSNAVGLNHQPNIKSNSKVTLALKIPLGQLLRKKILEADTKIEPISESLEKIHIHHNVDKNKSNEMNISNNKNLSSPSLFISKSINSEELASNESSLKNKSESVLETNLINEPALGNSESSHKQDNAIKQESDNVSEFNNGLKEIDVSNDKNLTNISFKHAHSEDLTRNELSSPLKKKLKLSPITQNTENHKDRNSENGNIFEEFYASQYNMLAGTELNDSQDSFQNQSFELIDDKFEYEAYCIDFINQNNYLDNKDNSQIATEFLDFEELQLEITKLGDANKKTEILSKEATCESYSNAKLDENNMNISNKENQQNTIITCADICENTKENKSFPEMVSSCTTSVNDNVTHDSQDAKNSKFSSEDSLNEKSQEESALISNNDASLNTELSQPEKVYILNYVCTCHEIYKANFKKKENVCQAIDNVDNTLIGCYNPVLSNYLVRSSIDSPFTFMCEMHLWKLNNHFSCPKCGQFCSQGMFMLCTYAKEKQGEIHLFHEQCQENDDVHSSCLHCGASSKLIKINVQMPSEILSLRFRDFNLPIHKSKAYLAISSPIRSGNLVELPDNLGGNEKDPTLQKSSGAIANEDVSSLLSVLDQIGSKKLSETEHETPLHGASALGYIVAVHLLIQAGINSNDLNHRGYTPLMLAVENNHIAIAQYLLDNGAISDIQGKDGLTSIHLAAKGGNLELLKILLNKRKCNLNIKDHKKKTPLVFAIQNNHLNIVKYLLKRGANLAIRDKEGNSCLHWATLVGNVDLCILLLNCGSRIDATNICGDTPLHIAARKDDVGCITLFIARGANVHILNKANQIPAECCPDKNGHAYLSLSLNILLKEIGKKYKHKTEKILISDISQGKERIAIPCINDLDDEVPLLNFLYITENLETSLVNKDENISKLQSCNCEDDCTSNCSCTKISYKCWYDKEGRLISDFNMLEPPILFECNQACSCWTSICCNRTFQKGSMCHLQLIRTKGKGWGVRTAKEIPRGTLICEYVGEVISDGEADRRENDSFLFDLEIKDEETYCLDARHYGNISRFINHLCEPNIIPVKVFIDHQDMSFPRIGFFSSRNIKQYEELGFDYGEKFWSIKYKLFSCHCGAPKCKYSKDTIYDTIGSYYKRLKEEYFQIRNATRFGNMFKAHPLKQ